MTSSQRGPYVWGYTHATMTGHSELRLREQKLTSENRPQFRSKAETRLREVGVASNRGHHTAVNMFPGLVHTARHVMGVSNTRSRWANRKEAAVEGGIGDWDE